MKIISFIKSLSREKSEPETLLKLLKKYPAYFETGLCIFIVNLRWRNRINQTDMIKLRDWIEQNKPEEVFYNSYWFKPGDLQSRIDYLKNIVKKQEEIAK